MGKTVAAVEAKVKASTIAVYLVCAAALAIVDAIRGDATVIAALPDWLEPFAVSLLPAAAAFLSGYQASHTTRPDLTPPDEA